MEFGYYMGIYIIFFLLVFEGGVIVICFQDVVGNKIEIEVLGWLYVIVGEGNIFELELELELVLELELELLGEVNLFF